MACNDGVGFGKWLAKDASRICIFAPQILDPKPEILHKTMQKYYLSLISLFEHKLDNNFGMEGVYDKKKVDQGGIIYFAIHVYRIQVWEAFHKHFKI